MKQAKKAGKIEFTALQYQVDSATASKHDILLKAIINRKQIYAN